MEKISTMPTVQEKIPNPAPTLDSPGHSLLILIVLDLITFGLYSAARCYPVHANLSARTGHRLFSQAFLHILIVLNLILCILRFSRGDMPWDSMVNMARLSEALLFISVLLIFRRYLFEEYRLTIRPLPLALFGFWYLQYRLNRSRVGSEQRPWRETWITPALIIAIYVGLALSADAFRQWRVSHVSMEPTLVEGDHVLIDQLSFPLTGKLKRGDIVLFRSTRPEKKIQIMRVLGLPGDRLDVQKDRILVNDHVLACVANGPEAPKPEALDQSPKLSYLCELEGRRFFMHRYQAGPLTSIEGAFEVPQQHYFVMGDNLDHSTDSRTTGPIPAQNILGRAWMTMLSYRPGEPIPWHRWFQQL